MIGKESIDKFKKLYRDKYNIELSDEEATDLATHFLNLMDILIHPKKPEQNEEQEKTERSEYEVNRI